MMLQRPAKGSITSHYGEPPTPPRTLVHGGTDFSYSPDDTVYAAAAGTVVSVGWEGDFGLVVWIDHGNGIRTRSCHFEDGTVLVRRGQQVAVGEALGTMGTTGNVDGKHLHFELWINGIRTNPEPYFTSTAGGNTRPIEERIIMAAPTSVIRNRDSGGIVVQFEPGCPLYPISLTEWSALTAATGAKYYDAPKAEYDALVAQFGTSKDWVKLAPSTHRSTLGGSAGVDVQSIATAVADEQYRRLKE